MIMLNHVIHILGKNWSDKVQDVHVAMKKAEAIAVVVTALDEVACECPIEPHPS